MSASKPVASTFDAALEAYLAGGDHERLLQTAGVVIDCNLPLDAASDNAEWNSK